MYIKVCKALFCYYLIFLFLAALRTLGPPRIPLILRAKTKDPL
jgi:hypothetical protein